MTAQSRLSMFTGSPLSESSLKQLVPSIFATEPHASRSVKFKAIPTIEILRDLKKEGFEVFRAAQSSSRDVTRREFTRHLLRLRHIEAETSKYVVGDNIMEIVLRNANDGTSAYDLFSGIFRVACLNGLISMTTVADVLKVRHNARDVAKDVIDGTYRVLKSSETALEAPRNWSRLDLTEEQRLEFGERARMIRFGEPDGSITSPFTAEDLLAPRRSADDKIDLWTVFNVTQENALKGGLSAMRPARLHGGRRVFEARRVQTREIKSVDQDVKFNTALWALGAEFYKELAPVEV